MTESQSPTGLDPNTTDTRDGQMKGHRWLIIAIALGAIILISILVIQTLLRGYMPHYSPVNFGAELERNRAKWDGAHITHYKIVVDFSGYGTYNQMPWALEVKNDKVVSIINAQGNSVPADDSAHKFTVIALFVDIEERYQRTAPSIQVSYNPTYGYPEDISINPYIEPCCQGYDIEIQDFQVLP